MRSEHYDLVMHYCLYLRFVDRQASWVNLHRHTDTFSAALNALAAPLVNTLCATRLILGSNVSSFMCLLRLSTLNSAGPRLYNPRDRANAALYLSPRCQSSANTHAAGMLRPLAPRPLALRPQPLAPHPNSNLESQRTAQRDVDRDQQLVQQETLLRHRH
ncbi:hypothetical protein C8R45DRAFT_966078 [Mycena sanguinolenta]|nr:hypothetical protein C8R45DRAFT_966078 [Mycena sanguinolenta]